MKHLSNKKEILCYLSGCVEDAEFIKNKLCDFELKDIIEASYALGQLQNHLLSLYHSIEKEDE